MTNVDPSPSSRRLVGMDPLVVGRYELSAELARGGMATVYVGRLHGDGGFKRVVAIKRLHAQFRTDDNLTTMFLDEARLAARIRHPNVVHAIDVALHDGEMFIVMEYMEGASLSQLMRGAGRRSQQVPFAVACAIVSGLLEGLHAAHDAVDEQGQPLGIVHRDVSPQNILVGTDGVARVLDFGIAKAVGQAHVTREGEVKGKLAYMAPEQLLGSGIERQADVFATGTILWELLTGRRLFYGSNDGEIVRRLLDLPIPPPSTINAALTPAVDDLVLRALERDPAKRFATAAAMAAALEDAILPATARAVGEWVRDLESESLAARASLVAGIESEAGVSSRRAVVADLQPADDVRPPPRKAAVIATLVIVGGAAIFGVGWAASRMAGHAPEPAAAGKVAEPMPASSNEVSPAVVALPAASANDDVSGRSPSGVSSVASSAPSAASSATRSAPKPKGTWRPTGAAAASAPKAPIYTRD